MARRPIDTALKWMHERKWKQADLARALGVSAQSVSNWKARDIPSDLYPQVADVFGRSVDELLGRPARIALMAFIAAGKYTTC